MCLLEINSTTLIMMQTAPHIFYETSIHIGTKITTKTACGRSSFLYAEGIAKYGITSTIHHFRNPPNSSPSTVHSPNPLIP